MKPRFSPRISLRVNGTRLGDPARPSPETTDVVAAATPSPRFGVRPALSTKPNEYMPDDEVGS